MNKDAKKYCLNHNAIAVHDAYLIQIHGIQHCVDGDCVYFVKKSTPLFSESVLTFHRSKVYYYADGSPYIRVPDKLHNGKHKRIAFLLDNFIKLGTWIQNPYFSLDELSKF